MASISYIEATCVCDGATEPAVDTLSLDVQRRRVHGARRAIGSGKLTALRMRAGLEPGSSARDPDRRRRRLAPGPEGPRHRDGLSELRAVPHMTVAENIEYALKLRGMSSSARAVKVREAAQLLVETRATSQASRHDWAPRRST
jgi:multiple sugar transport system ATP-binding protein